MHARGGITHLVDEVRDEGNAAQAGSHAGVRALVVGVLRRVVGVVVDLLECRSLDDNVDLREEKKG